MNFSLSLHLRLNTLFVIILIACSNHLYSQTERKSFYLSISPYGNDLFRDINTKIVNNANLDSKGIYYYNISALYSHNLNSKFYLSPFLTYSKLRYQFSYEVTNQLNDGIVLFENDREAIYNMFGIGLNAGVNINKLSFSIGACFNKIEYLKSNFETNYGTIIPIFDISNQSTALFEFKEYNIFFINESYLLNPQMEIRYSVNKSFNIKTGLIANFGSTQELYYYSLLGNKNIKGESFPINESVNITSDWIIWSVGIEVGVF